MGAQNGPGGGARVEFGTSRGNKAAGDGDKEKETKRKKWWALSGRGPKDEVQQVIQGSAAPQSNKQAAGGAAVAQGEIEVSWEAVTIFFPLVSPVDDPRAWIRTGKKKKKITLRQPRPQISQLFARVGVWGVNDPLGEHLYSYVEFIFTSVIARDADFCAVDMNKNLGINLLS